MKIQPIEMVSDLSKREYFWMKHLNTVFPYGLNLEYKCEKVDNALAACDAENLCIYKSFPKLEISRGRNGDSNFDHNSQPNTDFDADYCFQPIYSKMYSPSEAVKFTRKSLSRLNKGNAQKLWLYCIRNLNLYKSRTLVDRYKHCLLLVKDMSYHYAYRQKQFREVKDKNPNFLTLDFCNKLVEEVNLNAILNDKAIIERFPFDLLDGSKPVNWENLCKPSLSYKYSEKIRGKVLNYNQVLSSEDTAESLTCNCHKSTYSSRYHNHIVTGDMNYVKDANLLK